MSAGGKRIGAGSQGKGNGTGAMTDLRPNMVQENRVLSNRDKSRHTKERGQDGKWLQTEQLKDHEANKDPD